MAVLLGVRVLQREERQTKEEIKKQSGEGESVGVEEIRHDALRRLRGHTFRVDHKGPAMYRNTTRSSFSGRRSFSLDTRRRPLVDV